MAAVSSPEPIDTHCFCWSAMLLQLPAVLGILQSTGWQ